MERKFDFSVGEFYHVYNRGNSKMKIFLNSLEKKRFVRLLFLCNGLNPVVFKDTRKLVLSEIERGDTLVDIGAYCIMDNHFHLLLREKTEDGISKFMEKLSTAYSMFFNKKHGRTGRLFENRFRAVHIDNDNHLKYMFAYIHLNPIGLIGINWKEGINDIGLVKVYLSKYRHSSYLDWINNDNKNEREEHLILNRDVFPKYFANSKGFHIFINEWLRYEDI